MRFFEIKLAVGFVLSLSALATIGLLSYFNTRAFIETNRWVVHTYRVIESLEEILSKVDDAEAGERSYIITGEDVYLAPFRDAYGSLETKLAKVRKFISDNPGQIRRLDFLVPLVRERLAFMREIIELRKTRGFVAAQETLLEGREQNTMDELHTKLHTTIRSMIKEERRLLTLRHQQTDARGRRLIWVTAFGTALALTLLSLAGFILHRDFVQRKKTGEVLRQQADIIDNIHDSVVATDLNGYVTSWNQGAQRLFGYRRDEALGRHISFVYPEDQSEFLERQVIEPLKQKGNHEVEVRMQTRAGEAFWAHLSLSLLKNSDGIPVGMIGYSIDITPRKSAEEEVKRLLRELNERVKELTALHETARLLQTDPDTVAEALHQIGVILTAAGQNPEATAARIQFDGREYSTGNFRPDLPGREVVFTTATGRRGRVELAYLDGQGPVDQYLAEKQSLIDSLGEMLAAYFERKEAKTKAEQSTRELVERNKELWRLQEEMGRVEPFVALGRITGTIAHELGTPLNSILGYSQLLGQESLPEKARARVKVIETQVRRMAEIIDYYLSNTRGSLQKRSLDVNRLISETVSLLEPIFDRHGIQVAARQASLPPVKGEEASLQRVLINVLNNAVDAMPEGGKLEIASRPLESAEGKRPGVMIQITDTGVGIAPELLPKVFDFFVTTKPPGKGTGLGLAVSQEIVKGHGGTMKITSNVGEGTQVEIFLPVDEDSADDRVRPEENV